MHLRRTPRGAFRAALLLAAALLLGGLAAATELVDAATRMPAPRTVIERMTPIDASAQARSGVAATIDVVLPIRTNLVGGSWTGTALAIELRAHDVDDGWSDWVRLAAGDGEGPDRGEAVASDAAARRALPTPAWVGSADRVQVRPSRGSVHDLRLEALNTTGTARPGDRIRTHGTTIARLLLHRLSTTGSAAAEPSTPQVVSRAAWGADESLRRASPRYAGSLRASVIHHTVNANGYTRAEASALVRGIYAYHVRSNGWNDIGYNFLVDRFGRTYEGRYGGITRPVIGAHALGFNTGTTGIAMLGTYTSTPPTSAQQQATVDLLSWRLDRAHVDPTTNVVLTSAGNGRFVEGERVRVRSVSGHRDLWSTSCPGTVAWRLIDDLRARAWAEGGPKIAGVSVASTIDSGGAATAMHVGAHSNAAVNWTTTLVRRSTGKTQWSLTSSGRTLDASWPGTLVDGAVPAWDLDVRITASAGGVEARPVTRRLQRLPPAPRVTLASQTPALVTPVAGSVRSTYRAVVNLDTSALVTVQLLAGDDGSMLGTLSGPATRYVGQFQVSWGGVLPGGGAAADGAYVVRVLADDPAPSRPDPELLLPVRVDGGVALLVSPTLISPDGDGIADAATVSVVLRDAIEVSVHVVRGPDDRLLASGPQAAGTLSFPLPGATATADGTWIVTVTALRDWGMLSMSTPVRVDTTPPTAAVRRINARSVRIRPSERVIASWSYRKGNGSLAHRRREVRASWTPLRTFGARRLRIVDRAGHATTLSLRR